MRRSRNLPIIFHKWYNSRLYRLLFTPGGPVIEGYFDQTAKTNGAPEFSFRPIQKGHLIADYGTYRLSLFLIVQSTTNQILLVEIPTAVMFPLLNK